MRLMPSDNVSPLFEVQREKAGATTLSKYLYQYHWALYRMIQEHQKGNEYAIFVELHEDVVISNSLNELNAEFEFNQVKTTSGKFTVEKLVKQKNGSSVLGKLVCNCDGKRFSRSLSSVNLVSCNGYNLPLGNPGLSLSKISVNDLEAAVVSAFLSAMKAELSITEFPKNINFIIPNLSEKGFVAEIKGHISDLVDSLFPGCHYNSIDIYRVLFDDILKKGIVTFDDKSWSDLLRNKALTSNTVTEVINQFTNLKNESYFQAKFDEIKKDLGLNYLSGVLLERSFKRYRQKRVGNRSVLQNEIVKIISSSISTISNQTETSNIREFLNLVKLNIDNEFKVHFKDETDYDAAIIHELINLE